MYVPTYILHMHTFYSAEFGSYVVVLNTRFFIVFINAQNATTLIIIQ